MSHNSPFHPERQIVTGFSTVLGSGITGCFGFFWLEYKKNTKKKKHFFRKDIFKNYKFI